MKLDRLLRLVLGVVLALAFVIAIAALIFITESALNVWDRLRAGSPWVLAAYVVVLLLLVAAAVVLIVRLLVRRTPAGAGDRKPMLSRGEIEDRLRTADRSGVDVAAAQAELSELAARQAEGAVHLCFFGEISTGKSSLIKALVPDAEVTVDAVGGSTEAVRHYRWRDAGGTQILLTDVPGTGGLDAALSAVAVEEAQRAHVVLYVCDGDLTRAEKTALDELLAMDKPVVLVMNKSDRYSSDEQALLLERLFDHLSDTSDDLPRERVVAVSAGGETAVVERRADGSERRTTRKRPADIGVLVVAVNRVLEGDRGGLDTARDRAVFELAADKLAAAESEYREQRAEQLDVLVGAADPARARQHGRVRGGVAPMARLRLGRGALRAVGRRRRSCHRRRS